MTDTESPKATVNHPEEFYLPDADFIRTRPLSVGRTGEAGEEASRDHVGAEREVASIARNLIAGPNGNMVVYLAKPKSMRLLINQARALTDWHGPATAALLMMSDNDKAHAVASVSKQQMLWLPAQEWVASFAKLLAAQYEGDSRLAVAVDGKAQGLPDVLPLAETFARQCLGLD